jgi:purine-cytosine permease-like protein
VSEEASQTGGEFERQPVPERALLGFKSFIGMYAGEHCAGTELMIGPLFVAAGVSAFDVVVGLIIGNALAVLSWMFLTAPIAVRARETLYFQLEKICGRKLVTIYNLANGVMFCFLAGAMITVSATAVGVWFRFPMPGLGDFYPNSGGWVLAVLGVGALISVVAAYGYGMVVRVANIAAPWMVLVFLAFRTGGAAAIHRHDRRLGPLAGRSLAVGGRGDLAWGPTVAGPDEIHVLACDVLRLVLQHGHAYRHVGPDGLPFCPQELVRGGDGGGHVCGAFHGLVERLDAVRAATADGRFDDRCGDCGGGQAGTLPAPLPGPLAYEACGLAGLLCVIIAGWTTANPTIYRAGLAFQAIAPRSSRFAVTLFTGAVATVAAMFPALAMKLLDFVALYGMLLMPMGAVIFVDFWLARRLGFQATMLIEPASRSTGQPV